MESKRLFDCIEHQLTNFPQEAMFAAKENGGWRKYPTTEVASTVNALSAGLLSLGLSGLSQQIFFGYKIGNELILLNGIITFLGLLMI